MKLRCYAIQHENSPSRDIDMKSITNWNTMRVKHLRSINLNITFVTNPNKKL